MWQGLGQGSECIDATLVNAGKADGNKGERHGLRGMALSGAIFRSGDVLDRLDATFPKPAPTCFPPMAIDHHITQ